MSDVLTPEVTEEKRETVAVSDSPFSNAWSETPPAPVKEATPAANAPAPAATSTGAPVEEQIIVPKEWLKKEFDIEDPAILKAEREEYRKLKETPQVQERTFANDQSKLVYEYLLEGKEDEALEIINRKKTIDRLTSGEVTEQNAADILKMSIKSKYSEFDDKDVERRFNKQYGIPREPVFDEVKETEDEFNARHEQWKEKVSDIKADLLLDAKVAKTDLLKLKSEIVLPELSKPAAQKEEQSPELLEKAKKIQEEFFNRLDANYAKFEGYSTMVKDESVEIPIAFKVPDEAKVGIKNMFKEGFDLNGYLDKRWSDESGQQKIEQIISDIYVWENLDKILSGVANDAANKRFAQHLKEASNIHVNGGKTPQQTFEGNGQQRNISPFAKDAWSEKPPISHN